MKQLKLSLLTFFPVSITLLTAKIPRFGKGKRFE